MCPFPGPSTHSAGSEFLLCHVPKSWVTKHNWIAFQHHGRVFPGSSQLANFVLHGMNSVRALAPHLLLCFVSHLPGVFLVRLVLLIKVGHGSCQQWVNTVVPKTQQSFSCCLQRAYPAAAGKACLWWWWWFRQLPRNLSASTCLQCNAGEALSVSPYPGCRKLYAVIGLLFSIHLII